MARLFACNCTKCNVLYLPPCVTRFHFSSTAHISVLNYLLLRSRWLLAATRTWRNSFVLLAVNDVRSVAFLASFSLTYCATLIAVFIHLYIRNISHLAYNIQLTFCDRCGLGTVPTSVATEDGTDTQFNSWPHGGELNSVPVANRSKTITRKDPRHVDTDFIRAWFRALSGLDLAQVSWR